MCLYSTFVSKYEMRKAKVGENLTHVIYRGHNCFVADDGKVACIKPHTEIELTIRLVNTAPIALAKWDGKTVRAKMIQSYGRRYSADCLILEGDEAIGLGWLAKGVTMRIPRKVRKDAGTKRPRNLDKVLGLDQIKADIPVTEKVSS